MTSGELISEAIREVTDLRGPPAVVVALIFNGYFFKMVPRFPNRLIPLVNAMLAPVLTFTLVGWPTPDTMAPGLRWPELAAWITAGVQSLLLLCMAWVLHTRVLRLIIDNKVPALNPGRATESNTVVAETTSEDGTEKITKEETKITETKP